MKSHFIENIAEGKITRWLGKFNIPDVNRQVWWEVIIFLGKSAEMNCLLLIDAKIPDDIQCKIEYISYVSVFEWIAESHQVVVENYKVEKFPVNMKMDIIAIDTFSDVRYVV